jgi:hypothetical protein
MLAAACVVPALSSAHVITQNDTLWSPNNNIHGCFYTYLGLGESGGGKIHLQTDVGFGTGACTSPSGIGDFTSGAAQLMLFKYTGSGPLGGWSICRSWIATQATGFGGDVGYHVDLAVPCGGGTYAAGLCAGPSGYSSLYWAGHSTYVRNCADNYVNWDFTNGTHDF